ncbi:MAG: universal stress protein [Bordetella sp.]|uniref:universal stress protein n=1 Tax=Bordetella sp. TaxID=28081 RepID=UPI003F7CB468
MFKKILISTDGSALSNQAADAGIDFASSSGAEIVAVFVAQPMEAFIGFDGTAAIYAANYEQDIADQGGKYLSQLAERAKAAGVKAQTRIVTSYNVADGILRAAEDEHCDLIFMGSHGRSGLSRLVLGSVAARVVSLAGISTLVFRVKKEK